MIERIVTGDLGVNTYLFNYKDKKIVIIDPGDDAYLIIDKINKNKFSPMGILLTHGHFDHIGAVKEIKSIWDIPVYIHSEDAYLVGETATDAQKDMLEAIGITDTYNLSRFIKKTPNPSFLLKDGEYLNEFKLEIIHTPGHSKGSSCFYSKENKIIFTGDTLFRGGLGRTDFPGGSLSTLEESIVKLLRLPGETKVFPGHGPDTKISNEKNIMQLY